MPHCLCFSVVNQAREFDIFNELSVAGFVFGGLESLIQSNYKAAFWAGLEVPCFVSAPLLWIASSSVWEGSQ